MNRKEFLRNSVLLGTTLAFSEQNAFAGNLVTNGIDRLADEQGSGATVRRKCPGAAHGRRNGALTLYLSPRQCRKSRQQVSGKNPGSAGQRRIRERGFLHQKTDTAIFQPHPAFNFLDESFHSAEAPKGDLLRRINSNTGLMTKCSNYWPTYPKTWTATVGAFLATTRTSTGSPCYNVRTTKN